MKKHYFVCAFTTALLATSLSAQVEISGIINHYTAVNEITNCNNSLVVSDTAGFEADMIVLLYQAQGAAINTDNDGDFGDIRQLRGAGFYERSAIDTIIGNRIFLKTQILHDYDPAVGVQLVTVPVYEDAIVVDVLRARPWDGQTGGIIALRVDETLNLSADINASGAGFRGGKADLTAENDCSFFSNANDYSYARNDWRGGGKGEGVSTWLPNRENGRGAQANGGGGGNDHNSGGGGGAQLTAGGKGGENRQGGSGCDGEFPGRGGKALSTSPDRLFFGGGGGAGHENNDVGTDGGNGGGIIFLDVENLVANNFTIRANGTGAANTSGDGAGGGGAGGTVVLDVASVTGELFVEARGGDGGSIDNRNQERCHGPGGGGSGGRIVLTPGLLLNTSLAGGQAGRSTNSMSCGNGTNGAQAGNAGEIEILQGITQGPTPTPLVVIEDQPTTVEACLNRTIELPVRASGTDLSFQWQIDEGNGFVDLTDDLFYQNTTTSTLTIANINQGMRGHRYRLRIDPGCEGTVFSDAIKLTLQQRPIAGFSYQADGRIVRFENTSANSESYVWDFGDQNSDSTANPVYTFEHDGTYTVTLTANNPCGKDEATLILEIRSPPQAEFSHGDLSACQPFNLSFNSLSSDNTDSLQWFFPGGQPAISNESAPVVSYDSSGLYTAMLVAVNPQGVDTFIKQFALNVLDVPHNNFILQTQGKTLFVTNYTTGADTYEWSFGDGASSFEVAPSHTYLKGGNYRVRLRTTNSCGVDTLSQAVTVGEPPAARFSADLSTGCSPAEIRFTNQSTGDFEQLEWSFPGGTPSTSNELNPSVIYRQPGIYDVSLSVRGALGESTIEQQAYVQIFPFPKAAFDKTIDGADVLFSNYSSNANRYLWEFGDGNTSTENSPRHRYERSGVYTVVLNAYNPACGNARTETINLVISSAEQPDASKLLRIYPNPVRNRLVLAPDRDWTKALDGRLFNSQGQAVHSFTLDSNLLTIATNHLAPGLYWLQLTDDEGNIYRSPIVKQ